MTQDFFVREARETADVDAVRGLVLAHVDERAATPGIEHMKVDLGLTKDRGERFALWALLFSLGSAPDLDVAFKDEADREAARNFMDLILGSGAPD